MSFQEKTLWWMFISLLVAFVLYFLAVLPARGPNVMPDQVAMFVIAVVLLVILQIVGITTLAIMDRRTETDERDRLIALKGTRNGSYMLATGVFLALCVGLVAEGNFVFMHVLLAFWVLAQLVETGSQLFLYRRGA